jgi:hypothetical protein
MATPEQQAFHDELVAHRLIVPSGVPGVWARSDAFESVLSPRKNKPGFRAEGEEEVGCASALWGGSVASTGLWRGGEAIAAQTSGEAVAGRQG